MVAQREPPELAEIREHMIVDGRPVAVGAGKVAVYDPATGDVIAPQVEAGPAEVDVAVQAAKRARESPPWHSMAPAARERPLLKRADLVEADAEPSARLETLSNGRPLRISRTLMAGASQRLCHIAGLATKAAGDELTLSASLPPGVACQTCTWLEPVGVVAAIVPWNFPRLMASWKLPPALAADFTAVLKPPEEAPLTAIRLAELALDAGFSPSVVNVITGRGEATGPAPVARPLANKVTSTCSTVVGREIGRVAMGGVRRALLELGGKSPVVVMDAPMISAKDRDRVAGYIAAGKSAGARIVPQIKAGTVWVNTHNIVDPNLPFGGYKQSGFGRGHGRRAIESSLETKSVCVA